MGMKRECRKGMRTISYGSTRTWPILDATVDLVAWLQSERKPTHGWGILLVCQRLLSTLRMWP
ncbi:MAG: hypothetical protein ACJASY_003414 [Halioglobus sp.]|jgi:hypothetical protein